MSCICFCNINLVFDANECHLNMGERDQNERLWKRECVRMFVWWFLDRTSKTQSSKKTACSVCIISHTNMHTVVGTLTNPRAHTKSSHTNAANHSSIFYARMRKTSASLCKLQLVRGRKKADRGTVRIKTETGRECRKQGR